MRINYQGALSVHRWIEPMSMSINENEFGQPIGPEVPGWTPPDRPARLCLHGSYSKVEPLDLESHLPALFEAFSIDDSDWTYLAYGPFKDFPSFHEWASVACLGEDPLFYTLIDNETGKPGGMASYLRITPTSGTIEVGHIHLGPDLKRSRTATEAMFLMMDYAFSLGYRRYEWKCNALNAPSREAATRLGFTFEGMWRQASISRGRNRDTCWYSIIDADWPRLRNGFLRWLDPGNFDNDGRQRRRLQDCIDPDHSQG